MILHHDCSDDVLEIVALHDTDQEVPTLYPPV